MSRRKCCCAETCAVFTDDFDPPCTGTLESSTWDIISGTVTVVDPNTDSCASGGQYASVSVGGVAIANTPSLTYMQIVQVELEDVAGSKPRIIVNAVYDPATTTLTSYYYVELDVDAGKLRYGSSGGGEIANFDVSFTDTDTILVYLAMKDDSNIATLSAGVSGDCQEGGWVCITPATAGKYSGIANAGDATAAAKFYGGTVGAFDLQNHEDRVASCGSCDCLCGTSCVPRKLYGTLTKISGDACCDDGEETFELDYDTQDEEPCVWEGATAENYCGYFNHNFHLEISTSADRNSTCGDDWILSDPGGDPGFAGNPEITPDTCTCDPFYLSYTFSVDDTYDSCDWQLEITD